MRNKPLPGKMKYSPLKHHEKTPDGKVIKHYKKKTEMEFHPSLLSKPNVGPPYEKEALGYPLPENIQTHDARGRKIPTSKKRK